MGGAKPKFLKYVIRPPFIIMNDKEHNILSPQEVNDILDKIELAETDSVRKAHTDYLVFHYQRLVSSIAGKYNTSNYNCFSEEDIKQEGMIAVVKGIKRFDRSKCVLLTTYLTSCINKNIQRFINNNKRMIRLPSTANSDLAKIKEYINKYSSKNGRNPSHKKISDKFGFSENRIRSLLIADEPVMSLDAPIAGTGDDDTTTLLDVVECENYYEDELIDNYDNKQMLGYLEKAISKLKPKSARLLAARHGFSLDIKTSRQSVLEEFNITEYELEQIEKRTKEMLEDVK